MNPSLAAVSIVAILGIVAIVGLCIVRGGKLQATYRQKDRHVDVAVGSTTS